MTDQDTRYADLLAAKAAYAQGENIVKFLKQQRGEHLNTEAIIEIAYDFQAGSYIEGLTKDPDRAAGYFAQAAEILAPLVASADSLLDIGTGELTTITSLLNRLGDAPETTFAFYGSWSRLAKGREFASRNLSVSTVLSCFVADMSAIPLPTNSIDLVTSSHALEPNGGKLEMLLAELFRVAKHRLVLCEPCYELCTDEAKQRMDEHGYIKDLEGAITRLGGTVLEKIEIAKPINPLNPTVCFVVAPPSSTAPPVAPHLTVPGTDFPLELRDSFYFSPDVGLSFPILCGIPVLRETSAILTTALLDA